MGTFGRDLTFLPQSVCQFLYLIILCSVQSSVMRQKIQQILRQSGGNWKWGSHRKDLASLSFAIDKEERLLGGGNGDTIQIECKWRKIQIKSHLSLLLIADLYFTKGLLLHKWLINILMSVSLFPVSRFPLFGIEDTLSYFLSLVTNATVAPG